jgi:hypothetical protein
MKPAEIVNCLLAKFGVAIIRRTSLEHLLAVKPSPISIPVTDSLNELKEISRTAVASMELKVEGLRQEFLRQQISVKWDIVDSLERLVAVDEKIKTCPLCGHSGQTNSFPVFQSHCIFGGGHLTRFQCPACDVIFGAKKMLAMNAAELSQDYEYHYKIFQEGDSTFQEIRAFNLLKPNKNGTYLNYGAGGWSKSVQELRSQGWNVFGFEPHDSATSDLTYLIKNRADLVKMKFDGIFSNNVLEHLRHPVEELSFMKEILKPGARMSHATPCFEYMYEYTRFHLFFYLGRSRKILAQKASLVVTEFLVDGEFMCALYESEYS